MGRSSSCFNPLAFSRSRERRITSSDGLKIAQGPDNDRAEFGLEFAEFGGGCFWGMELAYQRVYGVTKTEAGYSQGIFHNPSYRDVCDGITGHCEVVRVVFDSSVCSYEKLVEVFWKMHDPTSMYRQGNDVGTQYRSGIYFFNKEQERIARESMENLQQKLDAKIVTEILPAKKFYKAEPYHQQYLSKGGRFGFKQSTAKNCSDVIRAYG
ncbi:hypothetical protein SELMODRAFT_104098 [Selaginella moellendorffii]|uniref:peptide-methionine (S)-S-oxide reductase n=1 Tax=Selaginella moellendorffii TaxID=88036 RepID=D8RXP5_SELML|nr:peptide methionine sulfoxide reductase A1 [Selaginella moellendorffii]EFJ22774.1 hypothetical protein SELMODRAFT_104098 [Selaginella moellendorffii]|eukprot:XP_002975869.1 peptide methionine sulfoxide reductase A1 [Selaginella moellendorffii]